jgi:MOSC domain-containing protein YiiM
MCKKWGCSEITGYYCSLIRNGEMSREEALEKAEAEEPREPPQILHQFLEQIQMTESEFDKALERDFREIPKRRRSATFRLAKKALNGWLKFRGKK